MKSPEDCASIEDVRRSIDALDREILRLIGERSRYVRAAARFKSSEEGVRASERRRTMLEERRRWAEQEGLSPDAMQKLYEGLIDYFVNRELEDWRNAY